MFERYPEKTFYRILKVEANASPVEESYDINRKTKVWVEKVFRGRLYEKPVVIESVSYKYDYRLLSKKEEKDYCQVIEKQANSKVLIAPTMDMPPLFRELISREKGIENPQMPVKIRNTDNKNYRIAQEGETPTLKLTIDIGKPVSPSLFKGINL